MHPTYKQVNLACEYMKQGINKLKKLPKLIGSLNRLSGMEYLTGNAPKNSTRLDNYQEHHAMDVNLIQ